MGPVKFWLSVLAFRRSFDIAQAIVAAVVFVIGFAAYVGPAAYRGDGLKMMEAADGWKAFALVLGAITVARLLFAPYWLWKEQKERADVALAAAKPRPMFKARFGVVVWGGESPQFAGRSLIPFLSISNVGEMKSAAMRWTVAVKIGDELVPAQLLHFETISLDNPPVQMVFAESFAGRGSKSIEPGETVSSYLFAVTPPEIPKGALVGAVLIVRCFDVLDNQYTFKDTIGAEKAQPQFHPGMRLSLPGEEAPKRPIAESGSETPPESPPGRSY